MSTELAAFAAARQRRIVEEGWVPDHNVKTGLPGAGPETHWNLDKRLSSGQPGCTPGRTSRTCGKCASDA